MNAMERFQLREIAMKLVEVGDLMAELVKIPVGCDNVRPIKLTPQFHDQRKELGK